jgi:hypothetical protein
MGDNNGEVNVGAPNLAVQGQAGEVLTVRVTHNPTNWAGRVRTLP